MDEFELAGFDEETCEQLRKISEEYGIDSEHLICAMNCIENLELRFGK